MLNAVLGIAVILAQEPEGPGTTPVVYRRFADRVVKVEVSETGSGAKAELGSGFFVSSAGHIVTNYHVIAKIVHDPSRYRAELVDAGGDRAPVSVLAVDVVHDLAVLLSEQRPRTWFRLQSPVLALGVRLYSLGHPRDLGLSIVEGTYNGLLKHTLYPRIHFTGSINRGMSGGPTITEGGAVAGVNVSTAGNQVSFLVPVAQAAVLVARATAPGYRPPDSLLAEVGRQIVEHQAAYVRALFVDSVPTVELGQWHLPTRPADFFNCWGDADREEEAPYEMVDHSCSTDDFLFVSRDHSTGVLEFGHRLISSAELNRFQFARLYGSQFRMGDWPWSAGREDVTPFRCENRNVRTASLTFQTQFCLRRYRKFDGLYDAILRAAPLGGRGTGVITTLSISGVSFENARALVRRYLESIR